MVHFRFIALVPMAFGILSSLLMSVVGAGKAIQGIQIYFSLGSPTVSVPVPLHLDRADQAMIAVIESVDAFLISIALLVFSMGVYTLFIRPVSQATHAGTAAVFQINSVSRLKQALMEVILVILSVLFVKELLLNEDQLYWPMLVIPAAVALLALALKFVKWHE